MTDPAMAALVQEAMTGGPASQAALREALAQHEDPRYRLIAEWAGKQSQANEQIIDVRAEPVQEPIPVERSEDKIRRLLRKLRSLKEQITFQREIGDTVAAALGACYLCWGDDPECEHCHGQGATGWKTPDPELFDEYVAPAVKRLQKYRNTTQSDPVTERSSS